jgi:hypothetical protein
MYYQNLLIHLYLFKINNMITKENTINLLNLLRKNTTNKKEE